LHATKIEERERERGTHTNTYTYTHAHKHTLTYAHRTSDRARNLCQKRKDVAFLARANETARQERVQLQREIL